MAIFKGEIIIGVIVTLALLLFAGCNSTTPNNNSNNVGNNTTGGFFNNTGDNNEEGLVLIQINAQGMNQTGLDNLVLDFSGLEIESDNDSSFFNFNNWFNILETEGLVYVNRNTTSPQFLAAEEINAGSYTLTNLEVEEVRAFSAGEQLEVELSNNNFNANQSFDVSKNQLTKVVIDIDISEVLQRTENNNWQFNFLNS